MKTKYTLIAAAFIILMIVLSDLNNSRTKQQLENIKYEAEERLMSPNEKLLKNNKIKDTLKGKT